METIHSGMPADKAAIFVLVLSGSVRGAVVTTGDVAPDMMRAAFQHFDCARTDLRYVKMDSTSTSELYVLTTQDAWAALTEDDRRTVVTNYASDEGRIADILARLFGYRSARSGLLLEVKRGAFWVPILALERSDASLQIATACANTIQHMARNVSIDWIEMRLDGVDYKQSATL